MRRPCPETTGRRHAALVDPRCAWTSGDRLGDVTRAPWRAQQRANDDVAPMADSSMTSRPGRRCMGATRRYSFRNRRCCGRLVGSLPVTTRFRSATHGSMRSFVPERRPKSKRRCSTLEPKSSWCLWAVRQPNPNAVSRFTFGAGLTAQSKSAAHHAHRKAMWL